MGYPPTHVVSIYWALAFTKHCSVFTAGAPVLFKQPFTAFRFTQWEP